LKRKHRSYGDIFYIDEVFAGVPDHSNQWQAVDLHLKLTQDLHLKVTHPERQIMA
jgi:hypothetical protein